MKLLYVVLISLLFLFCTGCTTQQQSLQTLTRTAIIYGEAAVAVEYEKCGDSPCPRAEEMEFWLQLGTILVQALEGTMSEETIENAIALTDQVIQKMRDYELDPILVAHVRIVYEGLVELRKGM
jgi:hypothetical protein